MNNYESAFELTNTTTAPIQFILEPWGNECELRPGSTVRVGFRSAILRSLPITHENGRVIVEGWEGVESTGIWLDGELVG